MELSGYVFSALRGGDLTLYRGAGDGLDPILLVAPIGEHPAREALKRLEHEHDLKAELDAGWAVRPLALSRHEGRVTLVLRDPGGLPLDQLLGQPMEVMQFLHIAIPLATAIGQVHQRSSSTRTSSRPTSWWSSKAAVSGSPASASPRACRQAARRNRHVAPSNASFDVEVQTAYGPMSGFVIDWSGAILPSPPQRCLETFDFVPIGCGLTLFSALDGRRYCGR
ncbi:MAG: histidine kinase [Devosia sp.]|uniref:hypothetical protein n=1 Tax=Devosia sp. TaxID=1871048 RepID=UPI002628BA84|nr:hypothetical protein [Devosia sp.]MDB5542753.1 histidine kinase [Devosia sp.]